MTDGITPPTSPGSEDPGHGAEPTDNFVAPSPGGSTEVPSSDDPTWPGGGTTGEPPASGTGSPTPGGAPTWPRTDWTTPTPDPTWPGGGWVPPGAGPMSGSGGWHSPAAEPPAGGGWPSSSTGWNAQGGGWVPPGAGWVPTGGGWVPSGGGWVPPPSAPPRQQRRSRFVAVTVVAAVVVLLLGTGLGYALRSPSTTSASDNSPSSGSSGSQTPQYGTGGSPNSGSTPSSTQGSGGSSSSSAGSPSDIASIAAQVDPELVDINTKMKYANEEAAGTGMVLTSNGEVLTNNHVIEEATTITATDIGNGKTYQASVVGYDRTSDVAVIQLKGASGLKTVSIGDSSKAATGQGVVGLGNAGGVGGTPSTAGGSITALNQSITASDDGDSASERLTGLIQTNCGIEPGDSGGPLVTTSGQVIGMDTAASQSTGNPGEFAFGTTSTMSSGNQGYSIPINEAVTLAKKFEAGSGSSTIHIGGTAFIGVNVSPTGATTSTTSGTGFGGFATRQFTTGTTGSSGRSTTSGADIAGVLPGTPASSAGLAKGDVITTFGGTAISSATALTQAINGYHPGDKVKVTWVNSSGQRQSATVTMANGPAA